MTESMLWWHLLKPHALLRYVPRHSAAELDELEERVRAAGRVRDPVRLVLNSETGEREIVDGLGRWEVGKRTRIEPRFEDLGRDDEVDVAAVILDYGTRRSISAEQKVQVFLDLNEQSERWKCDHEAASAAANAARSESARTQPREAGGLFGAKAAGPVSEETRPVHRERERIASLTGTSPATVSRVLARRKGTHPEPPTWKNLSRALSTATRSLESASLLSRELRASEIADEVDALGDRARLVEARVEAEFAGKR